MKTTFKCRSLANLTAHKRSYCQERFESVTHVFDTMAGVEAAQLQTVLVQAEQVPILIPITTNNHLKIKESPKIKILIFVPG